MCVALEAARDGLLDVVKAHIDSAQSQINDVDDEGYTAMHYAARYNRVAVMDALFAAGAGTVIHAYIYHSTISLSLSLSLQKLPKLVTFQHPFVRCHLEMCIYSRKIFPVTVNLPMTLFFC